MDKLIFGQTEVRGTAVSTTAEVNGKAVPALEIRVSGPVEQAVLDAMAEGTLEIRGEDGVLQGSHSGYSTVARHSVVLAKVSDAQQELAQTRKALAESEEKRAVLEQENAELLYHSLTGEVL